MKANGMNADTALERRVSLDFIQAVAQLLETDPDDILSEMGYRNAEPAQPTHDARLHVSRQESDAQYEDYYPV